MEMLPGSVLVGSVLVLPGSVLVGRNAARIRASGLDPCLVGRNAAVLQFKQFVYTDETTRRGMNNAATPKSGRFDEEWMKLDLVSMVMRGKADLQEASLILTSKTGLFKVWETKH